MEALMSGDDEQAWRAVRAQAERDPSIGHMGLEFTSVSAAAVTVRMPVEDGMRNAFGIVQGGFAYLVGDSAFAFAATASGTPMVTHHANVTYVAPARGAWLEATATVQHRYGRNAVIDVEVRDEGRDPVCLLTVHGVASRRASEAQQA